VRDIRARYKQAVLGVAWTILQPLGGTVALLLVFRRLIDVPSDGIPYALFALLGYSLWSYVSGAVARLTASLLGDVDLVTKVYFPRAVVPLAASLPGLLDLGVAMVVLAVLMAMAGWAPPVAVVLLPLVVVAALVVALGTGLWLATLNVLYRDVGHAVGFALQVWFFASPVAYPSSLVPDGWRHLYAVNPVAGLIDAGRAVVLGGPMQAVDLAISAASALLLLFGGVVCFQRSERRFADVI
jgi:ABC-type polysaccharide/polyol phosphate export permease